MSGVDYVLEQSEHNEVVELEMQNKRMTGPSWSSLSTRKKGALTAWLFVSSFSTVSSQWKLRQTKAFLASHFTRDWKEQPQSIKPMKAPPRERYYVPLYHVQFQPHSVTYLQDTGHQTS